ncbi:MAG: hypothetical protein JJT85_10550 [Chromatiales bacterium]|nr:hypothetical protein [Chromatiales bacterium]
MRAISACQPVLALFAMGLLAGCGGSSGGGGGPVVTVPDAPTLTLTPQSIKTFDFSWDEVSGATEYRLQESPDHGSGYNLVAEIAAGVTTLELEVFLPGRINASYILEACNSAGCTESEVVFVSGTLAEATGYFKASNKNVSVGTGIQFGSSVAVSADGTTLAVGGPSEASTATGIDGVQQADVAFGIGAVYVFSQSDGVWTQQAYVKASNTISLGIGQNALFGHSVALSADGSTLAVGAPGEASNATDIDGDQADTSASSSGAAYVFSRSGSDWSQQAYVKASNTAAGAQFGVSVTLAADGNTLAVGAFGESSNATGIDGDQEDTSASGSGAAYVFSRSGSDWSQQAYVKASNTRAGASFGSSVALAADGNTLAVGSSRETSNATGIDGDEADDSLSDAGAVYVFSRSGSDWSQQAYVKASNTGSSDFAFFGETVALSADGNTLAVGAPFEGSGATGIDGAQDNDDAPFSGAVYLFERSGEAWAQQAYVKASNAEFNNEFGWSVALAADGHTLAVGSPYEASNATGLNGDQADTSADSSGAAYVFRRNGGVWSQQAYVKASNTSSSDQFGWIVALAADASTLAVGARFENGGATGIGGDQTDTSAPSSGAVYLY